VTATLLDDAVSDFADLPEPEDLDADTTPHPRPVVDSTFVETVDTSSVKEGPVCAECGEVIIRAPGARGRAPKYHPHCRPSRKVSTGRGSKAVEVDNEVDFLVESIRKKLMTGAMLLSMVSPFDGFCVAIQIPDLCTHITGILQSSATLRKSLMKGSAVNSWISLGLTVVTIALPIMANHKMIPGKFVRDLLLKLPVILHRLHQKLEEGPEKMAENMFTQLQARVEAQAKAREKTSGS
jgi:hypothetical protein